MWPRARRFGNVYAFATVDCLYAILWFSAWVCVASYVAQGKAIGLHPDDNDKDKNKGDNKGDQNNKRGNEQDNDKDNKSGCDAWAYGNATKCKISTATVILGVVILSVPNCHWYGFLLTIHQPTFCCNHLDVLPQRHAFPPHWYSPRCRLRSHLCRPEQSRVLIQPCPRLRGGR